MRDAEFLDWVAARLVLHGDNPLVDFVGKLSSIARALPADQVTPNMGPDRQQLDALWAVDREWRGKRAAS